MNKRAAVAALLVLGCGAGSNGASEVGPTDASPSRDGSGADASLPPPPPDDAGVRGRSSIGWAVDYPDDVLTVIGAHTTAFTHVAVLVYDISTYTGGVAPFWNTPGGKDEFQHGLTSADLAHKVRAMGLKVLAGVMGGQEFGSNQGWRRSTALSGRRSTSRAWSSPWPSCPTTPSSRARPTATECSISSSSDGMWT